MEKCIISVTTYGKRANLLHNVLSDLVDMPDYKIVVTMYKPDIKYLSKSMLDLIDIGKVELITTDIDYRNHKKYIKVFDKYTNVPIITIDDDMLYSKTTIEDLYRAYQSYPQCINAIAVRVISLDKSGHLKRYSDFVQHEGKAIPASLYNMAVGYGGVIYPPNALHIDKEVAWREESDDILLKVYELRKGIKVRGIVSNACLQQLPDDIIRKTSLWPKSKPRRDKMFSKYYNDFKILERE